MASTTLVETTLGIRVVADRTDFDGAAVTDVTAEEDRFPAIVYTEGVLRPSNAFVPAEGAGATMNVVLGSGAAKTDYYVVVGLASGQGNYIVRLEGATASVTLDAPSAQARIDEVYIVIRDNDYDSTERGVASLAVRKGDAGADPSAPGPDSGWEAYALIASILVPASATDIEDCTITDERVQATILSSLIPDESVTVEKLEPSTVSSFLEMGGASDTTHSGSLTTSFATGASVLFTKPADWNTYKLMAWGTAQFQGAGNGNNTGEARISIGGNNGTALHVTGADEVGTIDAFAIGARHEREGLSVDETVSIQVRETVGDVWKLSSWVSYIAIRTS